MCAHHLLVSAHLYISNNREHCKKSQGEPSDKVCEIVDAPASFKCGVWNHFGLPISRNENMRKCDEQKRNNMQTLTHT